MTILLIDDCKKLGEGSLYSFEYFDTFNSLARLENLSVHIPESLEYLLQALEHSKCFPASMDKKRAEDLIQSTTLPELHMNICQAQMHIGNYREALRAAKAAFEQTQVRISLLTQRMMDPNISI